MTQPEAQPISISLQSLPDGTLRVCHGETCLSLDEIIEQVAQDHYIHQRGAPPLDATPTAVMAHSFIIAVLRDGGTQHPLIIAVCNRLIELKLQEKHPGFSLLEEGRRTNALKVMHANNCRIFSEGLCTCEPSVDRAIPDRKVHKRMRGRHGA